VRPRDVVLLVAIAAVWGFNFVPIRWALDAVPPFALAAVRFFFAAIPMVFFVRRPGRHSGRARGRPLAAPRVGPQ
jgi:O-acetylserine/cysteine efflux transporter